ncbi:hypothetical protein ACWEQ4_01085 [Rhodococcus sp. NPDC003994]
MSPSPGTVDAPHLESSAATDALHVTHITYDSESGWSIELARPSQFTDGAVVPTPADVPDDVLAALFGFLQGVPAERAL